MKKSKFIVFEGIDGSGKSTQARLLAEKFKPVTIYTKEVTNNLLNDPVSLAQLSKHPYSYSSIRLVTEDRDKHLDYIENKLQEGHTVICDRYILSTYAYNTETKEQLLAAQMGNASFRQPEFTIFMNIDVDTALKRISERESKKSLLESRENLFKVYNRYSELIEHYQGDFAIIDASKEPEAIHNEILDLLKRKELL